MSLDEHPQETQLTLALDEADLVADLAVPERPVGLVVFAHGSGSSRRSPRNRAVASVLHGRGLATLLVDLLTAEEGESRAAVFDIPLLAGRLQRVAAWTRRDPRVGGLGLGFFGASTGAAAALHAAAGLGRAVGAVVSRGGRPDLAADHLALVTAPTLLIVGEQDREVLELNRRSARLLRGPAELAVVPRAGHLFEEPGALDVVAGLAGDWFERHLPAAAPRGG